MSDTLAVRRRLDSCSIDVEFSLCFEQSMDQIAFKDLKAQVLNHCYETDVLYALFVSVCVLDIHKHVMV